MTGVQTCALPISLQVDAQVARAGGEVDDRAVLGKPEHSNGPTPQADVEAEGHDAVDEVVARGDLVEHVLHSSSLFVAVKQALGIPRRPGASTFSSHEQRLRPQHAFGADRGAW